jgi:hypothetical protein
LAAEAWEASPIDPEAFGKLCLGSEWRMVVPVLAEESEHFTVGETYSAVLGETSSVTVPMTLEFTREAEEYGTVLLVFSADRMVSDLSLDRFQNVSIEVDRVSGIYVPKDVVQRVDGLRGVYVLRGNVVYFRRIDITYEGSDYYLVKAGVEDADTPYLQVNDLIILNGKNMFDGRVLD